MHIIEVSLAWLEGQLQVVSGSEDGNVRVWSLSLIFDDQRREEADRLYEHSFSEHSLPVTDIVCGVAGHNAIIVSASEDCTCKVWNTSGKLLRSILFPTIINAIALSPGEEVFYASGRDGKIYIAALSAESSSHCCSPFSRKKDDFADLLYAFCFNYYAFSFNYYAFSGLKHHNSSSIFPKTVTDWSKNSGCGLQRATVWIQIKDQLKEIAVSLDGAHVLNEIASGRISCCTQL